MPEGFEAIASCAATTTLTGDQDAEQMASLCRWAAPSLKDGVIETVPGGWLVTGWGRSAVEPAQIVCGPVRFIASGATVEAIRVVDRQMP